MSFQDILDRGKEFQVAINENELFGDSDYDKDALTEEQIKCKNKELEKRLEKYLHIGESS